MTMQRIISKSRLDAFASVFVTLHPHETSALLHSSSCFFFVSFRFSLVLSINLYDYLFVYMFLMRRF